MSKKRITWIDICRCIAIIFVIIGHSLGVYFNSFIGNFIFSFHMPIFFVLSGYLFSKKKCSNLFKNGTYNLLMPYATTIVVEMIILLFSVNFNNPFTYSRFGNLTEIFLAGMYGTGVGGMPFNWHILDIGAIWFLLAMFIASQIFNIVMKLYKKDSDLILIGIISLALTILGILLSKNVLLPWSINSALGAQIFLFSGLIIKKFDILQTIKLPSVLVLTGIWIYSATIGMFGMVNMSSNNIVISIIAGIASSVVVMKMSIIIDSFLDKLKLIGVKSVLLFIGMNSLTILCMHLIDLDSIQIWNKIIQRISNYNYALVIAGAYRIIFAIVSTWAITKIPIVRSFFMHREYPIKKEIFK